MLSHSRQRSDGRGQVWAVVLIEKLVFNVACEKIGVAGSHFGAYGQAIDLFPPQGFDREAKTRGGIIVSPAYTYKECVNIGVVCL